MSWIASPLAFIALVCIALVPPESSQAGGYSNVDASGTPLSWSGPITFNLDLGTLGTLTNANADILANAGISVWDGTSIPTSALSFVQGPDLASDVTASTSPIYNDGAPDGITPIIYDHTGNLTASLFGGAEQVIVGFAGPRWSVGTTITEGRAVLNGLFIDGAASPTDVTLSEMQGVFSHEIGHMLNLDHSVFNTAFTEDGIATHTPDYSYFPTMYPIVHEGMDSLELDDEVWISNLYPTAAFTTGTGSLSGVVRDDTSIVLNGVNVIARSTTDNKKAISSVTGFTDGNPTGAPTGTFLFPGLTPGDRYTIELESLLPEFTGGSSVGPIDPPIDLTNFGPIEFLNDAAFESTSDDVKISTTFVAPAGGTSTALPAFELNGPAAPTAVAEVELGSTLLLTSPVTVSPDAPVTISGSYSFLDVGVILVGGDGIEDWYEVTSPAPFELNRVRVTSSIDMDFVIASWDSLLTLPTIIAHEATRVAGATEEHFGYYDSSTFGNNLGADTIYIGVSGYNGELSGSYTLEIETSVADSAAVAIDSVTGSAPGVLTINGRGFRATSVDPIVTFSDPNITASSVTFISPTQLQVAAAVSGAVGSPLTIQVTNDVTDGGYGGRLTTVVPIVGVEADLGITIADSPDPVMAGNNVIYTITAENFGPDIANSVVGNFTLSPGLNYVSDTSTAGSYDSGLGVWDGFDLNNGASETLTITAMVDLTYTSPAVTLTGDISSLTGDSTPGNDSEVELTTVIPAPQADVGISITDTPDPVIAGNSVVYSVTAENRGPDTANIVAGSFTLSSGLTYSSHASSAGTYTSGTGAWDTFSMSSGSTETLTITADVSASYTSPTVSLTGLLGSLTLDLSHSANMTAELTNVVTSADVELTTFTDNMDPVNDGDMIIYTITAQNNGPSDAQDVTITYTVPPGMNFISAPGCVFTNPTVTCDVGVMAPGATATIVVTIEVPISTVSQTLSNNASVSSSTTSDPVAANNSDIETTVINGGSEIDDWRKLEP